MKHISLLIIVAAAGLTGCTSGPIITGSTARTVTVDSLSASSAAAAAEAECQSKGGMHARFVDVSGARHIFNCYE